MEFSEVDWVLDDQPIRQGDIISLHNATDPWGQLGVIVTADCDITWDKHRGRLSYVPVLTATEYLSSFYLPKQLERLSVILGEQVVQQMHALQKANLPQFPAPISAGRALDWLIEHDPERVADSLLATGPAREALLLHSGMYLRACRTQDAGYEEQWAAICTTRVHLRHAKSVDGASRTLLNDARNFMANLPGDALFVSRIGPDHDAGYVCYLRILHEIRHHEIARKLSQRSFEAIAERIARLRPPYVYRLTQQLASVFAAIALPDEYENARRARLEELAPDKWIYAPLTGLPGRPA